MEAAIRSKRVLYIDIMRVFAVFCMVLLHVAAENWPTAPVTSTHWQVLNIYDSAVRFCVPLLIMISGALFLNPAKTISLKNLFKKNILRLVVAYIFWAAFYATYTSKIYLGINAGTVEAFFKGVLAGHFHMWFIPMIIGLYLITPLLRKITAEKKATEYFLILSFIFVLAIPMLRILLPAAQAATVATLTNKFSMQFVLGYSIYFVGGYYFNANTLSKTTRRIIYALGILSCLFTIIATSNISVQAGKASELFYSYSLPTTAFIALSVFLFFKETVSKINFKNKTQNMILLFSRCSFGVYLVHAFFLKLCNYFGFTSNLFNPIISVPAIVISIFVCSFIVSYVISKIPVINKYLI